MNPNGLTTKTFLITWIKLIRYRRIFTYRKKLLLNFIASPKSTSHTQNSEDISGVSCPVRLIHCGAQGKNFFKFIRKPKAEEPSKDSVSLTDLKKLLQNCKSVPEQIQVFHSYVKLNEEDIINRRRLSQDLEKILKSYFPACSLIFLGSSVTGLGLKGCDIDLSFQFSTDDYQQHTSAANPSAVLTQDIELGKVPASVIPTLPPKLQLHFLQKTLNDYGFLAASVLIPGRCPILSFFNENYRIDLSIHNKLALHSTNFMLLCQKLDSRIAPLYQIITYWIKQSRLVGGPMKFKSYAVFLLTVYFLQTRHPPVLPNVEYIFEKAEFLNNFGNWHYDVFRYIERFERSENTQSVEELLRQFFFFYTNFDFSSVICPITSSLVEGSTFISKDDTDNNAFEMNTISIQDPLNAQWNVTSGVNWKYCRQFIKELVTICDKYQNSYCSAPSNENWGLLSIIDNQYSPATLAKRKVIIEIPLSPVTEELTCDENQKVLLEKTAEKVLTVFDYCLNFHCSPVNSIVELHHLLEAKNVKCVLSEKCFQETEPLLVEINNEQHLLKSPISRLVCSALDTWFGRSNFCSLVFGSEGKPFDVEHDISVEMCKKLKGKEKEAFHFMCECWSDCTKDRMIVILTPLNSETFLPKLGIFLKEYVPKLCK